MIVLVNLRQSFPPSGDRWIDHKSQHGASFAPKPVERAEFDHGLSFDLIGRKACRAALGSKVTKAATIFDSAAFLPT